MGGNARERHGLFRCGAFVATRVCRPTATSKRKISAALWPSEKNRRVLQ
jgi:hypothetical protein